MTYRCPECRTRRKSWGLLTQHIKDSGHGLCHCGGYHYGHRPFSPYCERNPQSGALLARRYGASDDEVLEISIQLALEKQGRPLKRWPV